MKVKVQLLEKLTGDVAGVAGDIREVSARSAMNLQGADMAVALAGEHGKTLDLETLIELAAEEAAAEEATEAEKTDDATAESSVPENSGN